MVSAPLPCSSYQSVAPLTVMFGIGKMSGGEEDVGCEMKMGRRGRKCESVDGSAEVRKCVALVRARREEPSPWLDGDSRRLRPACPSPAERAEGAGGRGPHGGQDAAHVTLK